MIEKEIWLPISGYNGYYEISNNGKVRSLDRIEKTFGRFGKIQRIRHGMVLKPTIRNGYDSVELNKDGKIKRVSIHRTVADTFIRKVLDDETVHHIDKNKKNNALSNLEILSYSEHNKIHAHKPWNLGLKGFRAGEKRAPEIYVNQRKMVICIETGEIYESVSKAAEAVGKKCNTMCTAIKKKTKTGGLRFEYYRKKDTN